MSKGAKSNPTTPTTISPAIAYKMNKKIAQLTKVVYALNTKNEDHSTEVESIINAYEIEIQSVINQGNEKIQELAMELEVKNIEMSAHDQLGKDNHNLIALAESKNTDLKNENSGLNQRITSLQEYCFLI